MFHSYASTHDLLNACAAKPAHAENQKVLDEYTRDGATPYGWLCKDRASITGFRQAFEALRNPLFPEGVARIEKLAGEIQAPTPVSIRRKIKRDDHGDELDMGRVWQGDLERAWTHAKRQRVVSASRVLCAVFIDCAGGESSEKVAWRGVAALSLANAFELAGYSVEIRAFIRGTFSPMRSKQTRQKDDMDILVKGVGDPFDIHRAASMLASTLLFRGVTLQHSIVTCPYAISGGIGTTDYSRATEIDATGFDFVAISGAQQENARTANAWLKDQAAQLEARNEPA